MQLLITGALPHPCPQGTLSHMSPELLMKGYLSKASDVYAVSATQAKRIPVGVRASGTAGAVTPCRLPRASAYVRNALMCSCPRSAPLPSRPVWHPAVGAVHWRAPIPQRAKGAAGPSDYKAAQAPRLPH